MRKLFLFLIAILLIAGIASAHTIAINPKDGPMTQVIPVYNNSGSVLDAGDVVVWDIGSSTGDNDNYVTTTTTADTVIVAGVVYPADISTGDTGSIVIYGVVDCDISSIALPAGSVLCSSATAGAARACADGADAKGFGHTLAAITASSSGKCFVNK